MRPIYPLLGLVIILGSGASAYVATRLAATPEPVKLEPYTATPQVVVDDSQLDRARVAEDKLAMLSARLDAMTAELEGLRNSARREPAAVPVAPNIAPATNAAVTPEQRQTVLAVLAEERAREAAEAEAKRLQADQEVAQRRAARVAKDLNLSPGDETRLADLMFEGGKKAQAMRDNMRNGSFDPDTMRTEFENMRKWQSDQYTVAFGAAIADQILQNEGDRMGFGRQGGPGGFGGGNNGGNGGNGGGARGARRANANGGAGGQNGAPPVGGGGGQQQN